MTRALRDMAASLEKASAQSFTCCNLTPAIVRASVDIHLCPPAALTSEQSPDQAGGEKWAYVSLIKEMWCQRSAAISTLLVTFYIGSYANYL